jgi:hypothetical protein
MGEPCSLDVAFSDGGLGPMGTLYVGLRHGGA